MAGERLIEPRICTKEAIAIAQPFDMPQPWSKWLSQKTVKNHVQRARIAANSVGNAS
jgi:hypothetical protein